MNKTNSKLSTMKFDSIEPAISSAIAVKSSQNGLVIAHLIPLGGWIMERTSVIRSVAEWRNKYMRFYLTQFEANLQTATSYLESKANSNSSSIFFMIADVNFKVVGHIGFSNILGKEAELDNVLIGEFVRVNNFMKDVEIQIIDWVTNFLDINRIYLKVLSYNHFAINLHQECGFKTEQHIPLRRMEYVAKVDYESCTNAESDLDFECLIMSRRFPETESEK